MCAFLDFFLARGGTYARWSDLFLWLVWPGAACMLGSFFGWRVSEGPSYLSSILPMVWYGMVWYGLVWYGMVWYGMVWYGIVWYGMVWYHTYIGTIPI